ncbi:MAG TPA: replication protein, partial [Oscillibacter sp.]|nr:replication protein [Oscillibacter sp.]
MANSRKWLITINNPLEHGFDHARIKAAVLDLPSVVYWCMCDEQGDECATLHTHVYFVLKNTIPHERVDARFPSFHRDIARGKSSENRAYVLKDGEKFN